MTVAQLRSKIIRRGSHFFDTKTMKFFGDRMANYGVRAATIETYAGEKIECWELYRKYPVKYGLTRSAYFHKDSFEEVFTQH